MSSPESPDGKPEYILWPYTPTMAAGVVTAIVMFILFFAHSYLLVKNRTWFCIPFVIGALFEAVGYCGRAAAANDTESKGPYIIQSVLILLAPILFAASIYMLLSRLMQRTASTHYSVIRVKWLTKIFVGGDVLCFLIQSGGAGLLVQASDADGVSQGENMILGGLVLQIVIFGIFVVVAGLWHHRLNNGPTASSADVEWVKVIWMLYIASSCVMVRNLCRVVEYALGKDGYLLSNEWPIYVYDFCLMVITLIVAIWFYNPNIKPARKVDVEFAERR